jgi:ubiquinone biosynthesis protein
MTRQMLLLLSAFTQYDPEGALRAMERIGMFSRYNLTSALRRDVQRLINRFIDRPLKELSLHELGGALIDLTRRHRLHMPPSMAIIIKTLIMIEGTGVKIDPDLDVFALARPYAQRALAAQYTPGVVADRWFYSSRNVSETVLGLPQQVGEVLYRLETGDLKLQTQEQELPRLTSALMGAANRLAVALVLAGLLIGFGLVAVALDISQWNISILIIIGSIGGAVTLVLGLALAFALLRGRDV